MTSAISMSTFPSEHAIWFRNWQSALGSKRLQLLPVENLFNVAYLLLDFPGPFLSLALFLKIRLSGGLPGLFLYFALCLLPLTLDFIFSAAFHDVLLNRNDDMKP